MQPTISRRGLSVDLGLRERWLWAAMLVSYCVLDPVGTYLVLQSGGVETTPVAMWFLTQFGSAGLLIQKLAILPVIAGFAVVLTIASDMLNQPARIYRSVVPVIFVFRGIQLAVIHAENLLILW